MKVELDVEIDLPRGRGPHPAIICLHPASDRNKDQYLFLHLARVLPPRGIAVGRFVRRGYDVPLDLQVDDTMSVVAELERRPEIDGSRIGLWGFSQGAWVAPLAASRSRRIAFLVLLASTGVTPAEQMLYGTARQVRDAGFSEDAARAVVETRRIVDDWRRGRIRIEQAQRAVDDLARQPWFEQSYVPRDLSKAGEWRDMDFDPTPIFAGVQVPTLLFYGEDDEWSPIDASIAAWRSAAQRSGNRDVTIVRLEGTKHAPTIGGVESIDAVSPRYERTLVEWLERVTRR